MSESLFVITPEKMSRVEVNYTRRDMPLQVACRKRKTLLNVTDNFRKLSEAALKEKQPLSIHPSRSLSLLL